MVGEFEKPRYINFDASLCTHARSGLVGCKNCLDACPTDAFPEPYVLDARRCISYLTIELRNEPIPVELREGLGEWVFGCDICQEVCPWNRDAPATIEPAFEPVSALAAADALELLGLDESGFQQQLGSTPLERPGRTGLVRNAAIVAGNSRRHEAIEPLVGLLDDGLRQGAGLGGRHSYQVVGETLSGLGADARQLAKLFDEAHYGLGCWEAFRVLARHGSDASGYSWNMLPTPTSPVSSGRR